MKEKPLINWNVRKFKTQKEINEEIEREFSPKAVKTWVENGVTVTKYEAR